MKFSRENFKKIKKELSIGFSIGLFLTFLAYLLCFALVDYTYSLRSFFVLHREFYSVWLLDTLPFVIMLVGLPFISKYIKLKEENKILDNRLNTNSIRLMDFSSDIGSKKLDTPISILDDNDVLGQVMQQMQKNFINYNEEEEKRNWVNVGKEAITKILQENQNLNDLVFEAIKHLADFTNTIQSAFYILEEIDKEPLLKRIVCYAYNRKKYQTNEFKIGEGLIGQCAFEKATILRTEIPEDYVSITSGLIVDKKPNAILIIPVINDDKLLGVMEFASITSFDKRKIQLIEEVADMLSRSIFNISTNERTLKMLHEAQKMTSELQQREEELRQNAEEMQASQEELRRVNNELEIQFEEIENNQRKQSALLENASEMITIYNKKGEILYESPAVFKILGYTQEEMLGTNIKTRIHPKGLKSIEKAFNNLLAYPDKTQIVEFTYTKKDGSRIWLEAIGRNLIADKAINGIVFNSRDITQRRKAEKEQILRGRMQALSENSEDLIMRLDKDGKLYYVNPVIKKYLGLSPEEVKDKSIIELNIEDSIIENWKSVVSEVYQRNCKIEREMEFKTNGDEFIMHLKILPEHDETGMVDTVLMVSHDITERKKTELLIKDKNQKITQSINYAKRIQEAILPDNNLIQKYLPKSFMYYKPKDVVSGDFPWFYEKGDDIYLAAVDCTGHGVPGAMMSLIGYFLLNQINSHTEILSPAIVLDKLDEAVRTTLRQDDIDSKSRDGMDVGICKINLKTKVIEYAGAHRPLYLVRNGELEEFKGNRKSIGGRKLKEEVFFNHKIDIKRGDTYYYFSDGLPDQFGGPDKKKFSPRRIRDLIVANNDKSMSQISKVFEKDFEKWMTTYKQIDDVLLIGVRF